MGNESTTRAGEGVYFHPQNGNWAVPQNAHRCPDGAAKAASTKSEVNSDNVAETRSGLGCLIRVTHSASNLRHHIFHYVMYKFLAKLG